MEYFLSSSRRITATPKPSGMNQFMIGIGDVPRTSWNLFGYRKKMDIANEKRMARKRK
jgi:hypothetical protein